VRVLCRQFPAVFLLPKGNSNGTEMNQGKGMKEVRKVKKQRKKNLANKRGCMNDE
jgi:hypothetical protein